jgi:hypothetical protein
MILSLVGAVIVVILIVFAVIHFTKGSSSGTASGTSSPSTGAAGATTSSYTFKQAAAKVGKYPLNKTLTKYFATAVGKSASPVSTDKAAGKVTKNVVGVYDLTSATDGSSADYKGIVFAGWDGTFNPAEVIKTIKASLTSTRMVSAGTHGGQMICGYDSTPSSTCAWVTKTTIGEVQFLKGDNTVKYAGASKIALEVRNVVEVKS